MRRLLILALISASVFLSSCAGSKAVRTSKPDPKTQALVQDWAKVWVDLYALTGSLPAAENTTQANDNGRPISDFSRSLDGRGGNLARTDTWNTWLRCYIAPGGEGKTFVIASTGPNRVFDSNLANAARSSECFEDDVICRVTLTGRRTPPSIELLKGAPLPKPVMTLPKKP